VRRPSPGRTRCGFVNGVNEELAATAVFGSQLASILPAAKYDGVLGMWYGKGPGVDRSGDIFKHANLAGVGKNGGVLALAGDDPACKSSTIPSQSEPAFWAAGFPVLYPGSVQEVLDLGLHGYALSRCSGLWVGVKCRHRRVRRGGNCRGLPGPRGADRAAVGDRRRLFAPSFDARLFAPLLAGDGGDAALLAPGDGAQVCGGQRPEPHRRAQRRRPHRDHRHRKTWFDLRQAMRDLGLEGEALQKAGVRLLKVGMPYPLEPGIVREFAEGLEEILVVEEKRSFLEMLLREVLYGAPQRPRIVGKLDEAGDPLVPSYGELDADSIAPIVAARLAGRPLPESARSRIATLDAVRRRQAPLAVARSAYFCSGCPHNTSTVVPEGSIAGGGIGCHTMAIRMDRSVVGLTPWAGRGSSGSALPSSPARRTCSRTSATARSSTPACWPIKAACLPA